MGELVDFPDNVRPKTDKEMIHETRARMSWDDRLDFDLALKHMSNERGTSAYAANRAIYREILDKYLNDDEGEEQIIDIVWDVKALDEYEEGAG